MTSPNVEFTESDGALGALPSGARYMVVLGVANGGNVAQPAAYGRDTDIISTFGAGKQCPTVESAALKIARSGKPVVFVRAAVATAGNCSAITRTGAGTSVATVDVTLDEPTDDADVFVKFPSGGTLGVTGIEYQYSIDEGKTFLPKKALGTAMNFTIPELGVQVNLAAGTILTTDTLAFRCNAPVFDATTLSVALDALALSNLPWETCEIVGALDANMFDVVETKFTAMRTKGKEVDYIAHARMPTAAETEATYKAALDTIFSSKATTQGTLCAGDCASTSAISGRKFRRPTSFDIAAREYTMSEEQDSANPDLGPLPGVSIRDGNGNPLHHDEIAHPGLDDSRFTTLRTWDEFPGVYINRPRLFSAPGSDFEIRPHRRVMNLAKRALRIYFARRTSKEIQVDAVTGFILETEAAEIEKGANAILRDELLNKPKASGGGYESGRKFFQLGRTDNLLSSKRMTGRVRIVPLAYPEFISIDWGFLNPALRVVAV
jgi:hypothetical protein